MDDEHAGAESSLPPLVNAHTHCADAGVHPTPRMTIEELVAPPDGLKHRYLRETPREVLVEDMRRYSDLSRSNGISKFVDFREGGIEGVKMLREASPDAFIMGRPVSPEFDPEEMASLLEAADGIGLPSLTDMGRKYTEACADAAHKARKPFAIHVSERIREDIDFILKLKPTFVVHMAQATRWDLSLCADFDVPVVICPRSNSFFGIAPPIFDMIDAGVPLALGTDNAMLCDPDLVAEMAELATLLSIDDLNPGLARDILVDGSALMARKLGLKLD